MLVVEYGHLAVTKRKGKRRIVTRHFFILNSKTYEKDYQLIECMFSTLCILGLLQSGDTRKRAETTTKHRCPRIPTFPHDQHVDFYQVGHPQRTNMASAIRYSGRQPHGSHFERNTSCTRQQRRERPIYALSHKKYVHIYSPRPTRWTDVANAMVYRCRRTIYHSHKSNSRFY